MSREPVERDGETVMGNVHIVKPLKVSLFHSPGTSRSRVESGNSRYHRIHRRLAASPSWACSFDRRTTMNRWQRDRLAFEDILDIFGSLGVVEVSLMDKMIRQSWSWDRKFQRQAC